MGIVSATMKFSSFAILISLTASKFAGGFVIDSDRQKARSTKLPLPENRRGNDASFHQWPLDTSSGSHSTDAVDDQVDDHDNVQSRRNFVNSLNVAAISVLGVGMGIDDAVAVDFQMPDITKLTTGPNKQRIGGLANKIRNSCNIMVSSESIPWKHFFVNCARSHVFLC